MTDEKKEYDKYYYVSVCPYCNHSEWVNIEHGGFFRFKFDTYKCSKCSREFKTKELLSVVPKDEVERIVQGALDGKITKAEMKEDFKKIGIYIYLPLKRNKIKDKHDVLQIIDNKIKKLEKTGKESPKDKTYCDGVIKNLQDIRIKIKSLDG